MINWLKATKTANFYKAPKSIPVSAIVRLFGTLRNDSLNPSKNVFRHVKSTLDDAAWSAIAFFHEHRVPFLESEAPLPRERVCGFVLLIEYRNHVAAFRHGFDLIPNFKTDHLSRIPSHRVQAATARADAIFEQMSLRGTGVSKYALRRKTLEADDLQNVVGPAGATRYIPHGYRVRDQGERYSATPSTGRIALRADRAGYEALIKWAKSVIDRLVDERDPPAPFIRTFAQPIDLGAIPRGVQPTHFTVNVMSLADALCGETEPMELVRQTENAVETLSTVETQQILDILDQPYSLRRSRAGGFSILGNSNAVIGRLTLGKSRIALRAFSLPETENILVRRKDEANDVSGLPLKRYIDQNDLFIILFTSAAIVYLDGDLHRDDTFGDGGQAFLSHIRSDRHLADVTSEKGAFVGDQNSFEPNSVFRVVIDHIAAPDSTLICDDLGDEWADFIGTNIGSTPKSISFYHAKHGALSLGASAFHDSVGQAIKNLGRMSLSSEAVARKLQKWASTYVNNNIHTSINRVIRSHAPAVQQGLAESASSPDTIRRVFIVTSSLSRKALADAFEGVQSGSPPSAHFVQLYWLLSSYFSAALEAGVYPYVICRE